MVSSLAALLLLANAAPLLAAPDPKCEHGIASGTTCCSKECGKCGGHGCAKLPGGATECCGGHISRKCSAFPAPCNMGKPGPSPTPTSQCTTQKGLAYIGNTIKTIKGSSLSGCCSACSKTGGVCRYFTFDSSTSDCDLKSENAPDTSHPNPSCESGFVGSSPPAPKPPPLVKVTIAATSTVSTTLPNYVCYNIDARLVLYRKSYGSEERAL